MRQWGLGQIMRCCPPESGRTAPHVLLLQKRCLVIGEDLRPGAVWEAADHVVMQSARLVGFVDAGL